MGQEFHCEYCNYHAKRMFEYKRHLQSKKHEKYKTYIEHKMSELNDAKISDIYKIIDKKELKKVTCNDCGKILSRKSALNLHYKTCKSKKKVNNGRNSGVKKDDFSMFLQIINKKDDMVAKAFDSLEKMNKKLLKEQNDMKKIVKNILQNNKTIRYDGISESKSITTKHVIEHFTNAFSYDKLMEPPLDEEEEKMLETYGPIKGCTKLIQKRCIDGVSPDKRALHCIDNARSKFVVNINGEWVIDNTGEKILDPVIKKIEYVFNNMNARVLARINKKMRKRYIKEHEDDAKEDEEVGKEELHYDVLVNHEVQMQLNSMRNDKNWKYILRPVIGAILLSNVKVKNGQYLLSGDDTKQITE